MSDFQCKFYLLDGAETLVRWWLESSEVSWPTP